MSPNPGVEELLPSLLRLAVAFCLALPAGWARERSRGTTGLRTYPLVALAACGFLTAGRIVLGTEVGDQSNIVAGVLAGIGILGGGAILRDRGQVRGLADATGFWVVTGIGAAAAYDLFGLALIVSGFTFAALWPRRRADGEETR